MFAAAAISACLAAPTMDGCSKAIEAALTPTAEVLACAGQPKTNDTAELVRWFQRVNEVCELRIEP